MALELFGPEHKLTRCEEETEGTCFCCGDDLSGPAYTCGHCNKIRLHEACANLPGNKDHPFHLKHRLELVPNAPPNFGEESRCSLCLSLCHGFAYHCSECNFTLDIKCATSPKFGVGSFPELKHFGHDHPLLLIEDHVDEAVNYLCIGCEKPLRGSITCCLDCPFPLHRKCFDLPRKISHPIHRKHPLQLLVACGPDRPLNRDCNVCGNLCRGFAYNCRFCDVHIHVNCISPPRIAKGEIHPHWFSLLLRRCKFLCDGCGKEGNFDSAPYICKKCNLVLHKNCLSLQLSVKVVRHNHPLLHTFSIPGMGNVQCQLCKKEVNLSHGCYYCSTCDYLYVVHVDCARGKYIWDRSVGHQNNEQDPKQLGSTSSVVGNRFICGGEEFVTNLYATKEYKIDAEGFIIPQVIQHSFHAHHDLTICHGSLSHEKQCYACMLPVLGSPFYRCSEPDCEFFLDQKCALFLLLEHKHWDHFHMLTLSWYNTFICGACKYQSNGFFYGCRQCGGCICLRCNKIQQKFELLDSHIHNHSLFLDHDYVGHCSACGNPCGQSIAGSPHHFYAFRCEKGGCDFAVDCPCLTLPKITSHMTHPDHPLTRTFQDDEGEPRRCICDICEKGRDPKHWFYSCKECESKPSEFKAHPKCVLGKHPFIRVGEDFTSEAHTHTLETFRPDNCYPECDACEDCIEDVALKCKEPDCKYIVHWECREKVKIVN